MACEVLRILQLTDTALVPVSYLVPRKVRGDYRVMGACCRVMGDTSSALGDKGHLGVGAARSPAWEEQERRQNLGAEIWVLMVGNRGWVCWVLGLGS